MNIRKKDSELKIIRLYGRLDAYAASGFEKKVSAFIDNGIRHLILDCCRLEYINSAGLRMLLRIEQRVLKAGGAIILCSLKDSLQEIFNVTGWSSFLPLVDTVDEAGKQISYLTERFGSAETTGRSVAEREELQQDLYRQEKVTSDHRRI